MESPQAHKTLEPVPSEIDRGHITQWNNHPVGLRISISGEWNPETLRNMITEKLAVFQSLVQHHLFVCLQPTNFHDIPRNFTGWEELPERGLEKKSCHWHIDTAAFTALLCPTQDTDSLLPTGFSDTDMTLQAWGEDSGRNFETLNQGIPPVSDPHLLPSITNTLQQANHLYWHHWQSGDCLFFGQNVLHARKALAKRPKTDGGFLYRKFFPYESRTNA